MRSILCGECEKADETVHGVLCSVSPDRVLHTAQLCIRAVLGYVSCQGTCFAGWGSLCPSLFWL